MDITSSLVSLGIDFVPVHGLAPAFDILVFIWGVVQKVFVSRFVTKQIHAMIRYIKASNNKRALRNLVVSSADILSAVNHLLSHKGMNEHVRALLDKLEKCVTFLNLGMMCHLMPFQGLN